MTQELLFEFIGNHPFLILGLVIVVVLIIGNEFQILRSGTKSVTPQTAINLYNRQDAVFVDTRGDADFEQSHVGNALHIPSGYLVERVSSLEKYKEVPIIIYSQNGNDLNSSIKLLKSSGFNDVFELRGGFSTWLTDNMPVQSGRK